MTIIPFPSLPSLSPRTELTMGIALLLDDALTSKRKVDVYDIADEIIQLLNQSEYRPEDF